LTRFEWRGNRAFKQINKSKRKMREIMIRSPFTKSILLASSVLAIAASVGSASAGGFSSRQQSVTGQGFSYAGAGTSAFGIGSMFWNPAAITNFEGRRSEYNFTLVLPRFSVTTDRFTNFAGTANLLGAPFNFPANGSGNINQGTFTTAGYNSYQVNNWLWLGLQTGTPFGSRTKADAGFTGSPYGTSTVVRASAVTPTIGIKANEWLSLGFGLTVQQLGVTLNSGSGGLPQLAAVPQLRIKGDGYGIGFTAGATIKPIDGTEISLGYRSSIKHSLEGEFDVATSGSNLLSSRLVKVNVNLPEIATLGISQRINNQWTVTGTAQWTNWSRITTAPVVNRVTGTPISGLGFRYKDEWFLALGAQYKVNDAWKLRAGVAYEISPITDDTRAVRVLDNNRIWLSAGAAYKYSEKLELDFGYSHIFVKNGKVDIVPVGSALNPGGNPVFPAPGNFQFNGRSKGAIDIVSFSLKYRWDDPQASTAPIVKKF
jgi:long-chain fatty acid transport protein